MTREDAHQLVDQLFDLETVDTAISPEAELTKAIETATETLPEAPARELPKDKRVVRTNVGGDRVYMLDEVKMTRAWVSNPDVLDSLGFTLNDVTEVQEDELMKYQMSPALYRRVDEA